MVERFVQGYSVEMAWEHGVPVFIVVTPSGDHLYSFASRKDAEADVYALNAARNQAAEKRVKAAA